MRGNAIIKSFEIAGRSYRVSDEGYVLHLNSDEKIKFQITKDGYYQNVFRPTRQSYKCIKLHKIVWEAFNGPVPEGYEIDHIDNDRLNCRLDNLQLLTHAQNVEKAWAKNWLLVSPEGKHYEVYNLSKFCKEMGLDQKSMSFVMSGKRNHHKGWRKYHD